jgi:hypothetical protein
MPQHSAERLCLSGEGSLTKSEAMPRTSAAPPQINKIRADGKPEAYRHVLRQSRAESDTNYADGFIARENKFFV